MSLILAAQLSTAFQNVAIRLAADDGIHPFQIAWVRGVVGFVMVAAFILWRERAIPRPKAIGQLVAVGFAHVAAMVSFFYGVALIPLNESTALSFAAPLFGTIGAALFLGETVRLRRWIAVAIGFVGVLIVLRPGVVTIGLGTALVLVSTVAFAVVTLLFRTLSRTDPPTTIVFYQSLFFSVVTLAPAAPVLAMPSAYAFLMMVMVAVLGTFGMVAYTRAFAIAEASAILPFEFSRLPFIAIVAFLVFGERPDQWVWLGAAVIFGSTLYIAHREAAAARRTVGKTA
ncbi:MAG: DMT family transporter [Rhodospirillaceae bacterium]|nr:DMT family transporter [Rhodospirillaceae bacterium]